MSATITLDQFVPQKFGNLALVTGTVEIDSYEAGGVSLAAIERYFSDNKLHRIHFESVPAVSGGHGLIIATTYDRTTKYIQCFEVGGEVSALEAITLLFTAIGNGGL